MPSKKVDVQDLIRYVTAAQGKLPLALERVNRDFETNYKKEDMLGAIAGNSGDLADQLRTLLIMQMFDTQMQLQIAVEESLPCLDEASTVRFYTANAAALSSLMSRPIKTEEAEPVSFIDAKRNLVSKLEGYKERKAIAAAKMELAEATGTDGAPTRIRSRDGVIQDTDAPDYNINVDVES